MKKLVLIVLVMFFIPHGFSQTLSFAGEERTLTVSIKNNHIFRIKLTGNLSFSSQQDKVVKMIDEDEFKPVSFKSDSNVFHAVLGNFSLHFQGNTFTIFRTDSTPQKIQEFRFDENKADVFFQSGGKGLFGLGQEGMNYNRDKSFINMESGTFPGEIELFGSRVPIPFLISPEGWGLYIRQPYYPAFDLRQSQTSFKLSNYSNQDLEFFLILNHDPKFIVAEYYKLTGLSPMPPKWAMGYMQSHRTLSGPEEILQVANNLREKNLPCDALIYLGTGYSPSGWNLGHGSFSFNPDVFPKPQEQIDELHSMHYKVILHTLRPPQDLYGSFSDTGIPAKDTSHINNYWKKHQPLLKIGVDGFWPDIGDQLGVQAKLTRHRMYYEGPLSENANQRPFALHRTGYTGMQRYGGWIWSGDVYSTWETLKEQIALGINWSLSGSPFWGTDIGGFVSTSEYTGEMYVRWFQFATFCPSYRSHGRSWHLHTPWGWNSGKIGHVENKKDTKGVGLPPEEELHNEDVEPVCRKYLELRYRLLPYNYTLAWQAHKQGLPMMRAMWLYYPQDKKAIQADDQYFWGENILVAPVYKEKATFRTVYLPNGTWYDYWTNREYKGNQMIKRFVGLEDMPIYVKSGSIIPVEPTRQYVDQPVNDPMKIFIYTGKNGRYQLYEDDGKTLDYQNGNYLLTNFLWDDSYRRLTISSADVNDDFKKENKQLRIILIPGLEEKHIIYKYKDQTVKF